ncbi:hypothetical protein HPP92_003474 [Vanilla planifolia]|uniref:CUE domain-containing protein n=1 Tax=Vanilla planifolia TaxID=51239 RepID=A0A835SGJ1_VANPL|nr:hypothetical protein HPP92_003849 [Vanilla planifolia]KAG0503402.1 hypothetical protein HPP92_003474 [Vanilla planifolia]
MSALVCRKRSTSIFEELQFTPPSSSKRIRCAAGASSPTQSVVAGCFSQGSNASPSFASPVDSESLGDKSGLVDHLRSIFPHMDQQYLERALEACGNDLDSTIRSLNDLCLGSDANRTDGGVEANAKNLSEAPGEEPVCNHIPKDGSEWVDLFVREMMNASDMDDARARASRALDVLEKSIVARVNVETTENFHKESMILKEQVEVLLRENTILKRAVAIQHERQKDFDEKNQELQHLKHVVSQYQEQLRKLEVSNYALAMHLKQAQEGNSIPGRFHPDIF